MNLRRSEAGLRFYLTPVREGTKVLPYSSLYTISFTGSRNTREGSS